MEYIDFKKLLNVEKPSFQLQKAEYKSLENPDTVEAYREALDAKKSALQTLSSANEGMEKFLDTFFGNFHSSMRIDKSEAIATLMDEESPIRDVLLALYNTKDADLKKNEKHLTLLDAALHSEKDLEATMQAIEKDWKLKYQSGKISALQELENVILDAVVAISEDIESFFNKAAQNYRTVAIGIKAALSYCLAQLKLCLNIRLHFGVILSSIPLSRWDSLPMLMLTKDVFVGLPTVTTRQTQTIRLKDVLPITSDFVNSEISGRPLLPGAYILLGGPMSGKSLLINSIFQHLQRLGDAKTCLLHCMEPSTVETRSLLTWSEISLGLSALLYSDADIIAVDSLRFLNAASPYPAKRGGINSGLEIYATQLNELCVRANKVGFFVISTSDMSRQVTETYQALLVGSTQGVVVPGRITPDAFGKSVAPIEISLRNGDRSYQYLTYNCVEPLRSTQSVESVSDEAVDTALEDTDSIYKTLLGV